MNLKKTFDQGELKQILKGMKAALKKDDKLARNYDFVDVYSEVEDTVSIGYFQPAVLRASLYAMNNTIRKLNPYAKNPNRYLIEDDMLKFWNGVSKEGICDINGIETFSITERKIYLYGELGRDASVIILMAYGFQFE